MVMQAHDELVFEVAEGAVDAGGGQVRCIMGGVADLAIPLLVEVGAGANWEVAL
jgi:DNA polymerase-1